MYIPIVHFPGLSNEGWYIAKNLLAEICLPLVGMCVFSNVIMQVGVCVVRVRACSFTHPSHCVGVLCHHTDWDSLNHISTDRVFSNSSIYRHYKDGCT